MVVTVVNRRTNTLPAIYIGRGSIFGNPFPVTLGRERCIKMYKEDRFDRMMSKDCPFRDAVLDLVRRARLGDIRLECYCAPLECHGDIIKKYIDEHL
jgi:hypothetical protein